MNLKEAAEEIKRLPILTEFLTPAKTGYVCIGDGCKNGTGSSGTGAEIYKDDTRLHCFTCNGEFNNIDVIAHWLNLGTTGKDFVEVVKYGCERFGITLDDNYSTSRRF